MHNNDPTDHIAAIALPSNSFDAAITSQATPAATAECLSRRTEARPEGDGVVLWPLVNGGVTKVSPGDVDAVAQHVWRAVKIAGHSYAHTTIHHKRAYLQRLLCGEFKYWDESKGKWRTNHVDHVDNDGLNNTRENLRSCDHRQNQQNGIGHPTVRHSRFKRVAYCRNRKGRPWRAIITVKGSKAGHGLQIHGGYFDSEEAAARRYNEMAREHFGEFARPNEVDNEPHPTLVLTGSLSRPPDGDNIGPCRQLPMPFRA
jgi:hypothetical protein